MNFVDPDIRCLMIVERERVSLVAFYYIEGFIWRGGSLVFALEETSHTCLTF